MTVIAMTQEMATLGKGRGARRVREARAAAGAPRGGRRRRRPHAGEEELIRRIREGKASKIEKWAADEKTISIFTAEEVFDLAVRGNVLIPRLGRHAAAALRAAHPCVRVCAPLEVRVKRLMERLETDDEELARREIETDDAARAARMGEAFNVDWGDPTLYDLTLNTERIAIPTCVEQVVASRRRRNSRRRPNPAGAARPRASGAARARRSRPTTAPPASICRSGGERAPAPAAASSSTIARRPREGGLQKLDGVSGIDDELRTMAGGSTGSRRK
jgi:cytidylate kinase